MKKKLTVSLLAVSLIMLAGWGIYEKCIHIDKDGTSISSLGFANTSSAEKPGLYNSDKSLMSEAEAVTFSTAKNQGSKNFNPGTGNLAGKMTASSCDKDSDKNYDEAEEENEHSIAGPGFPDASFSEKIRWSEMDKSMISQSESVVFSTAINQGPKASSAGAGGMAGRMTASCYDSTNPNLLIAGSETGGIWKTINSGTNWITPSDQYASLDVNDISQDPVNTTDFYYAAEDGTADIFEMGEFGTAALIYKSTDKGSSWNLLNLGTITGTVRVLEHVPGSSTFYFGAGGSLYRATYNGGVLTYTQVYSGTVAIYDIKTFTGGTVMFSTTTKLFTSPSGDSGTFTQLGASTLPTIGNKMKFDCCTGNSQYMHAVIWNQAGGKVTYYNSTNGGTSWTLRTTITTGQGLWHVSLMAHPSNTSKVALGIGTGSTGVLISTDGGTTFTNFSAGHVDITNFTKHPTDETKFLITNDGGIFEQDWDALGSTPVNRNGDLSVSQSFGGFYFPSTVGGGYAFTAGLQDNLTYRYFNGTWKGLGGGGDGGAPTEIIQSDPTIGFGHSQNGNYRYTGLTSATPTPTEMTVSTMGYQIYNLDVNKGGDFTNERQVYIADNYGFYRSDDYGATSTRISDITAGNIRCFVDYGGSDPSVYVTTDIGTGTTGGLFRFNNAATAPIKANITIPEANKRIQSIACDPTNTSIIYVVMYESGKVYKVTNAKIAPVWTPITNNLGDGSMRSLWVEINPNNANNIYLGTYFGLYYTEDGGTTWFKNSQIPSVRVPQVRLRKSDNRLFVFTFGRGVWTTDCTVTTGQTLPTVTTTTATSIGSTTATSGGNVTADGGATVTARGVCWGTSLNPTTANSHTTDLSGTGVFSSSLTPLLPGTFYHYRAYATNSVGTSYGADLTFTTTTGQTPPTVTTTTATSIGSTTATSGGNVTSDGGATVTARGVCWGTSLNPTTANSHTTDLSGTGVFSSSLTPLLPGTFYHYRAYATNSVGTSYGNDLTFTTLALPTVTTTTATSIGSTTATSGGNVTAAGGATVTARGVCWGTSLNPTTANSHTTDLSGTGVFSSSLTPLLPGTFYHYRAYATNSVGTSYGNDLTFTTLALPTVTTATATSIGSTTATSGGNVTADGGATVTARGVCWGTSLNPTTANSHTTDLSGTGVFSSSLTPLLPGTFYHYRAYATNSVGTSYGADLTFTTPSSGYCSANGTTNSSRYIHLVSFGGAGGINRTSGADTGGYFYSTNPPATVTAGTAYTLSFNQGVSGVAYWDVWIDFNLDGDFIDTGEKVLSGFGNSQTTTTNLSITIPSSAANGTARMRVHLGIASTGVSPCGTIATGEVEDYDVSITGGTGRMVDNTIAETNEETQLAKCILYPNPNNGLLSLRLPTNDPANLTIYNSAGQSLQRQTIVNDQSVNVDQLPSGVYFLEISGTNYTDRLQFIKK